MNAPAQPTPTATSGDRQRLSLDLAPTVSKLLDEISTVTGVPRSQVAVQALLDAMPALLERVDALKKRQVQMPTAAVKPAKR